MRRLILISLILGAGAGYLALGTRAPRPNVLLVTIDTLRPDAVGRGTPAMDAFLAAATRFERARTVAPMTLPAHASMFTGLFPAAHGLHDNVTAPLPDERPFPLLAEEFRDAGYDTAAFVACGVLSPKTGISSGFRVYDGPPRYEQREAESVPADEVVAAAVRYVEGARGTPWFVWVHLFEPHAPYLPFEGDARRPATREGDSPRALYDGEVRRVDAALEKLFAAASDAVVVLASDHGESFGEHDETTHGPLCYGTTIDVLLAVRGGGFAKGAVDGGLRSVADIAPTIRRVCGIGVLPSDGRDLRGPPHETLVAESLFASRIHGWGQCFAATDGTHTLVESGPRLELFDRAADPAETEPLPLASAAYERLDRALEALRSTMAVVHGGDLVSSLPAYGQLRRSDARYLPRHENAALPDPRALLAPWLRIDTIPWLVARAREQRNPAPLESALRMLAEFDALSRGSPLASVHRASVCEAMAEVTRDRSWIAAAARARVDSVEKGYVGAESVRDAVRCAIDAGDPETLRRLSRALPQGLDEAAAESLRCATAKAAAPALGCREKGKGGGPGGPEGRRGP